MAIIVFVMAAGLLALAATHWLEKGFLFNNAYIYASKKERETMDKKPYYRQSAVVFLLLAGSFIAIGLRTLTGSGWWAIAEAACLIGACVWAFVSTARIRKKKEEKQP